MNKIVRDKTGRPIAHNDVIKIFHFFSSKKKKHYMYMYVQTKNNRLYASHLGKLKLTEEKGFYIDFYGDANNVWEDCTIVQSDSGFSK